MITLIIGSSSSGKSGIAENIATLYKSEFLYYIATMHPYGKDGEEKVKKHRIQRQNKGFLTIEQYTNIGAISASENSTILLECMSNLLANEMYDKDGAKENSAKHIINGIITLSKKCQNLVVVSNEVFSDGAKYDPSCMEYIENLALINRHLAKLSDNVIEAVVGIPIFHKNNGGLKADEIS